MSTSIDLISSELLSALDKLNNNINREIISRLLTGRTDIKQIHAELEERYNTSLSQIAHKITTLEKYGLIRATLTDDFRTFEKAELTSFGIALIKSLLEAQKIMEREKR